MATPGRLDALFDLSRKLASCLDLDDVLREVGLCASALTGAHAVSLERYDREARCLVAFGSGAPAVEADSDVARRVLKTHEPEVVEADAGSSLVAALVSRGESVGVMRIRYNERARVRRPRDRVLPLPCRRHRERDRKRAPLCPPDARHRRARASREGAAGCRVALSQTRRGHAGRHLRELARGPDDLHQPAHQAGARLHARGVGGRTTARSSPPSCTRTIASGSRSSRRSAATKGSVFEEEYRLMARDGRVPCGCSTGPCRCALRTARRSSARDSCSTSPSASAPRIGSPTWPTTTR